MPKKKAKYQNLIYVRIGESSDGQLHLLAFWDIEASTEYSSKTETEVGIYQFVKTAKVRTKIEII